MQNVVDCIVHPLTPDFEGKYDCMGQQLVCANCKIVIRWQATIVDGVSYCCPGCATGGPCECDYDNLPRSGNANPIVLHADRARQSEGDG